MKVIINDIYEDFDIKGECFEITRMHYPDKTEDLYEFVSLTRCLIIMCDKQELDKHIQSNTFTIYDNTDVVEIPF